jgi:thiosulfate reductase cytochrome b subunit
MSRSPQPKRAAGHPLAVRLTHWINAVAMTCMATSGWAIYNASPFFPVTFPAWATLGGWLGGAIAWHFAAMWLLCVNGLVYLGYGVGSGYLRRRMLPVAPRAVWRDFVSAIRFKLPHQSTDYNAVQRASYLAVILLAVLLVASGLAIWKPVQFAALTALFGGFDFARRVHFVAMAGVVAFVVVHLAMVLLVPRTLLSMLSGRAHVPASQGVSTHE